MFTEDVTAIEDYLNAVSDAIGQATDVAEDVSAMYIQSGAPKTSIANSVITESTIYRMRYDQIYKDFGAVSCPVECLTLRGYILDALSNSILELVEYTQAWTTFDITHIYEADKYYQKSLDALVLAMTEWETLANRYLDYDLPP